MKDRKEDLCKSVEVSITNMFRRILDDIQIACSSADTYKVVRARILRAGNNCIRETIEEINKYDVTNQELGGE